MLPLRHIARDCHAPNFVAKLYKDCRQLQLAQTSTQRETHTFDASNLDASLHETNLETFLVNLSRFTQTHSSNEPHLTLIDSTTTHTMVKSSASFDFDKKLGNTEMGNILTITGNREFRFREGWVTLLLPGGAKIVCEHAMNFARGLR